MQADNERTIRGRMPSTRGHRDRENNPTSPNSSRIDIPGQGEEITFTPTKLGSSPTQRHPYVRASSYDPPFSPVAMEPPGSRTDPQGASQGRNGSLAVDFGSSSPYSEASSQVATTPLVATSIPSRPDSQNEKRSGVSNRWWPEAPSRFMRSSNSGLVRYTDEVDGGGSSEMSFEDGASPNFLTTHGPNQSRLGSASNLPYQMLKSGVFSSGGGLGGYTSSAEGDLQSNPPSRLTSRAPTPSVASNLIEVTDDAPDPADATESEISEYDERSRLRKTALGGQKNSMASVFKNLGGGWQKEHLLGAPGHSVPSGTKARSSRKSKWTKMKMSDRGLSLHSSGLPSSSPKSRRRPTSSSSRFLHPLRMLTSLLGKAFRTLFGPIHPITIMIALVLISSFVASVTMLIIYILNPDKEPLPWRTYCQQQPAFPHAFADALAPVDVFVGVFSIDSAYERRHMIRSTYAAHTVPLDPRTGLPTSNVQVKFIIGRPRKAHARRVALEMETFNDIVVLDMEENMNRGKTHAYFTWAAENATVPFLRPVADKKAPLSSVGGGGGGDGGNHAFEAREQSVGGPMQYEVAWKKADYVVKADDDAYIILDELERHLRVAPRQMTYWGYLIRNWFMGGECYALSSDLVNYVATSEHILHYTRGKEDKKVAQWINLHPNRSAINWVSEHCWIYDHPKAGTAYSHGFLFPDYVEKIKLESRRGLSDQEIARRGGEHRSKSYSTVSKWHQPYIPPRDDLTIEEEVEALVEGGGRWAGTWVRGEEGNDVQVWVPWERIVFEANDERLRSPITPKMPSHVALAEEVTIDPTTGLTIRSFHSRQREMYPPRGEEGLQSRKEEGEREEERGNLKARSVVAPPSPRSMDDQGQELEERNPGWLSGGRGGNGPSGLLANLPLIPGLGSLGKMHRNAGAGHGNFYTSRSPPPRLIPLPSNKDGEGEAAKLRARRYLGRPHGGTVVVHFLKKSEWFYETALAFSGKDKTWPDGAGGAGSEWRVFGSPLVRREDNFVSEGRSQPRPDYQSASYVAQVAEPLIDAHPVKGGPKKESYRELAEDADLGLSHDH
ncbi:hypothetical protein IE53DRAFT_71576 [Violaceomyces palustris]|uniref:Uncharacterized protein n=1 Tax=Violaceomyces palustris TaxID=1673888 RepID=A0ACD0P7E3_9BASI|nr:hypothetical protein IE53DRAFT_71576 [Violaceomyces palustris]